MSPKAYFLTWTTYGSWLRGDVRGSVAGDNRFGTPYADPDPVLESNDAGRTSSEAVHLDQVKREIVASAIEEVCSHRGWRIYAANVRSNHVHIVVRANVPPEKVLTDLKAWATRRLRESGWFARDQKVWTKHGSTRYIFDDASLAKAVDYVIRRQDMKRTL
ncbi:MAG: transposase [Phycisphaeraceae bacterium]|nr:MAG: transposase [Phycisphaeraceae bacterium]